MYRFGMKADRWLPNSVAARKACFFPITAIERQSNPLAPQPTNARSASCIFGGVKEGPSVSS